MLAVRLVDHDHWEQELILCCHGFQPDDAGCRFFTAADHVLDLIFHFRVQHMNQVSAIINNDLAVML